MVSESRIIGKFERLCYERHEHDLTLAKRGHPSGLWFDADAAERPIQFAEGFCKHHEAEWAGQPLLLGEWQKRIIRILFGWHRADGTRRFRKAWIEVPRKNGKTTLCEALGLYLLVADGEPGAQVYATATKRDQAKLLFDGAVKMVRASTKLSSYVSWQRSNGGTLTCERLGARFAPLSADYGTLDGLSPHGDIRDEVHAWTDPGLSKVLDTATGARRQPLTIEITTAGVFDAEAVGWKHHEYARQVLEGAIEDDRYFAIIFAIDEGDDWRDPKTWAKANPNLGVTPKLDYVREQVEEATKNTQKVNDVLQLHFNRWTAQTERWLNFERWCEAEDANLREEDFAGRRCYGGLDLSEKRDLSAFVLLFPGADRRLDLICRFWLPESRIEEEAKKGETYLREWAQAGWITATPGDVIDHAFIRRQINDLAKQYDIAEIGFDPYHATQLSVQLREEDGLQAVEVRQGPPSLSEACKLFEATIFERKVRATGRPGGSNPVMRWMVNNAARRRDANGNIAPDKKTARGKIDGVSAAVTALSRIVAQDDLGSGSYLETSDLLVL